MRRSSAGSASFCSTACLALRPKVKIARREALEDSKRVKVARALDDPGDLLRPRAGAGRLRGQRSPVAGTHQAVTGRVPGGLPCAFGGAAELQPAPARA